jgi:hypothetical protein
MQGVPHYFPVYNLRRNDAPLYATVRAHKPRAPVPWERIGIAVGAMCAVVLIAYVLVQNRTTVTHVARISAGELNTRACTLAFSCRQRHNTVCIHAHDSACVHRRCRRRACLCSVCILRASCARASRTPHTSIRNGQADMWWVFDD